MIVTNIVQCYLLLVKVLIQLLKPVNQPKKNIRRLLLLVQEKVKLQLFRKDQLMLLQMVNGYSCKTYIQLQRISCHNQSLLLKQYKLLNKQNSNKVVNKAIRIARINHFNNNHNNSNKLVCQLNRIQPIRLLIFI